MNSITIEYRPLGILWKRRIEATMPSEWKEITADQLAVITYLLAGKLSDKKLVKLFLGVKGSIAKRIDSYQAFCITKQLSFLRKKQPLSYFIIPSIAGYNAPSNNLKGVTFGAFIFGDTYYQNYLSGSTKDLDRFIACFYCNSGFDESFIEEHARVIGRQSYDKRIAIAINYGLIREWLAAKYIYVFMKSEGGKKKEKTPGWVKVFDRVVGKDIVHQKDYANLSATEVLRYLNETTKEFYKNGGKV